MALHSVDNQVQSPDALTAPIATSNTAGLAPSIDGNNSVPQVLVGYQKDGFGTGIDQGIKVSQQGVNVNTATDSQLVMSSAFNLFKIVGIYYVTVSHPGTTGTSAYGSVEHNLGYSPAYAGFVSTTDGNSYASTPWFPDYTAYATPGTGHGLFRMCVVEGYPTVFGCTVSISGETISARDYLFKIYAFKETIS